MLQRVVFVLFVAHSVHTQPISAEWTDLPNSQQRKQDGPAVSKMIEPWLVSKNLLLPLNANYWVFMQSHVHTPKGS